MALAEIFSILSGRIISFNAVFIKALGSITRILCGSFTLQSAVQFWKAAFPITSVPFSQKGTLRSPVRLRSALTTAYCRYHLFAGGYGFGL